MIRTYDALLSRLQSGACIRETRVHEPEDKSIWAIATTDQAVHGQAVRKAFQEGALRPLPDGLFGEAQTYEFCPPEERVA